MLRVIGAGLGRTGTSSLKLALEQLLGGPCYHMLELHATPAHIPAWHAAARGEPVDWAALMHGYRATVDWPGASFWPEISAAFPDALVLLSLRDPEAWWRSVHETIFNPVNLTRPRQPGWHAMWNDLVAARFTADLQDKDACIAAYNRHNAAVRAGVAPQRLLQWHPGDGWEPICTALDLPLPASPFPHANARDEFVEKYFRSA